MSLCITALSPAGIVLAADSRQTYRNNAGMVRIGTDNAVKLFKLNERTGVVIAGRAFFPDSKGMFKNAGWFIEDFRINHLDKEPRLDSKAIAEKLNDYFINALITPEENRLKTLVEEQVKNEGGTNITFRERQGVNIFCDFTKGGKKEERVWHIESITFVVAGFDADGVGRAYFVSVPDAPTDTVSRTTDSGGDLRIGQIDVVGRIIKGWAPEIFNLPIVQKAVNNGVNVRAELDKLEYIMNWSTMTLQDSINYCVLMTRITESVQKLSDGTYLTPGGITGVGGAIDIAKITHGDGFQWIKQKELTVDDD